MKVTAIIEDTIVSDAMKYSGATTITDALRVALTDFIRYQKLKEYTQDIKKNPLEFNFSAEQIRDLNRSL